MKLIVVLFGARPLGEGGGALKFTDFNICLIHAAAPFEYYGILDNKEALLARLPVACFNFQRVYNG